MAHPAFFFLSGVTSVFLCLLFPISRNFEYEFSLALGLIDIFLIPTIFLIFHNKSSSKQFSPAKGLFFLLAGTILACSAAIGLFSTPCSMQETIFWMTLQWLPTACLCISICYGCDYAISQKSIRKTYALCALTLTHFAMILHLSLVLFLLPQKRITHFWWGFLHGPIYDEWIPVDDGIALARFTHLMLCLTVCLAIYTLKDRAKFRRWLALILIGSINGFLMVSASHYPSLKHGHHALEDKLQGKKVFKDFSIHYFVNDPYEPMSRPVHLVIEQSSRYIHILKRKLNFGMYPFVKIYLYPNNETKKLWFGGGQTDLADVYTPSIHISLDADQPHPTLAHELVHALGSDIAFHGLGFHPNMMLTEGLAVAFAPDRLDVSLDEASSYILHKDPLIQKRIPRMFSPFFWTEAGPQAYTLAGSFVQHARDLDEGQGLRKLYSGESWSKSFSSEGSDIIASWTKKVTDSFPLQENLGLKQMFSQKSLFQDKCVHSKSTMNKQGSESLWIRLRQPIGWDAGRDYWKWLRAFPDEEPYANKMLLNEEAAELLRQNTKSSSWDPLIRKIEGQLENTTEISAETLHLRMMLHDLLLLLSRHDDANTQLQKLLEWKSTINVGSSINRAIEVRDLLQKSLDEKSLQLWIKYLAGWQASIPAPSTELANEAWVIKYLRLRRDTKYIDTQHLLESYSQVDAEASAFSKLLQSEWYWILGQRLFVQGQWQEAKDSWLKAIPLSTSGRAAYVTGLIEAF